MKKIWRSLSVPLAGILISGGLWAAFITFNYAFFDFAKFSTGIGFVFVPAGVRLGLILIFGGWGAWGITLFNPLAFGDEFNARSPVEIALISAIAGFAPYLAVRISYRVLKIGRNLQELLPIHLPIISLIAAVISAVANNVAFTLLGYQGHDRWIVNTTMMALGDFSGCFIVLLLMWVAIKLYRLVTPRAGRRAS